MKEGPFTEAFPLGETAQAELRRLLDTIDFAGTDEPPAAPFRCDFYRPIKQSTTIRLDADVLAWLKSRGKGYQTRLNALLRDAMAAEARNSTLAPAARERASPRIGF